MAILWSFSTRYIDQGLLSILVAGSKQFVEDETIPTELESTRRKKHKNKENARQKPYYDLKGVFATVLVLSCK